MVDFDLEDLLKGLLPRKVGTFTLTKVVRVDENDWRLFFENPGVTRKRNGVVTLVQLNALFQWGYNSSGTEYRARIRVRKETNIPIRARIWLTEKVAKLDSEVCPSHVHNRIWLEERGKYFDTISIFTIAMGAQAAQKLVTKEKTRPEEFLVSFDKGFYQIGVDAINFVHLDQLYGEHIKKLSS